MSEFDLSISGQSKRIIFVNWPTISRIAVTEIMLRCQLRSMATLPLTLISNSTSFFIGIQSKRHEQNRHSSTNQISSLVQRNVPGVDLDVASHVHSWRRIGDLFRQQVGTAILGWILYGTSTAIAPTLRLYSNTHARTHIHIYFHPVSGNYSPDAFRGWQMLWLQLPQHFKSRPETQRRGRRRHLPKGALNL